MVIDNTPRAAWASRYAIARYRWEGGALDSPEFLQYLLKLGETPRYAGWLLIPTQDEVVELVARNRDALASRFTLVTQGWDILQFACDKGRMNMMARATGVTTPTTWYPRDEDDLANLDITYPAIIKPTVSIRLQHAMRLKALPAANLEEMRTQYRLALTAMPANEVMIQEIIPGGGECQFSVAAYVREGEIVASMTARRTRQYPIDYGLGSCFVEAREIPDILEDARKLLAYMGLTGMVEVEFKQDPRNGVNKLLDINVRPWGWHTLAIACGLDFPAMQYCDVIGLPLPVATPHYDYRWLRGITDLPAGLALTRAHMTTRLAYLRSLIIGKTTFSVFSWSDPLPTLMDAGSILMRGLKLVFKRNVASHESDAASEPEPIAAQA
jgi:predicted ATP-grasp superfamily ATP-dependent carboligase